MRSLKPDRRRSFVYRRILVTPQSVMGILGRTWKVCDTPGYVLVDTKARARKVIDALLD